MIRKLTPIGNSFGVVLPRPVLRLLNIDVGTPLEISTDGVGLIVKPLRGDAQKRGGNQ